MLRKVFTGRRWTVEALRGVDFTARRGSVTALVGPNGAGKTTLLKILSTLILPTSGEAYVDGMDVVSRAAEVRRRIGLVTVSDRLLYYRLSGLENLTFYGILYGMSVSEARSRARDLLEVVGLGKWGDEPTMHYSTGMTRRLAIARSLMHDPDVILLDEPTLGIDAVSSRRVRALVRSLSDGRTVVLTSHLMKEVEELSDSIYVMRAGQVIARGSPGEIISMAGRVVEAVLRREEVTPELSRFVVRDDRGTVLLRAPADVVPGDAIEVREVEPTLEDAYVLLAGEGGADVRPYQFRRGGAHLHGGPV
ncbi:ABC transporter ATP-binding protein [Conexivisphaera calida]|uniref:ABC transporter, ATP-binding protein n=1 Tax=Conexivisphaera calida TaxID=1874277 RepID=A0A4P2VDN6_9ARCH|nr:ABC transporter ATP-binding protein [Conexivisphaera calida]BBE42241.1 ABC transporter, ATP-binding protein [Conexivisphaera calida]